MKKLCEYKVSFKPNTSSSYRHVFGGREWKTPKCCNCDNYYHQILSLDLNDPRLGSIMGVRDLNIPLISCLNCSSNWGEQFFKIEFEKKQVIQIYNNDKHNWIENDDLRLVYPLPQMNVSLELLSNEESKNILNDFGIKYFITVLGEPLYLYSNNMINSYCPLCHKKMTYLATVCSDFANIIKNFDFQFGEQWLYFYYCNNCETMKAIGQST